MKLVAGMIVRNELGRYLEACVGHLLEFCDEVRILDDASDDGTAEWITDQVAAGRPVTGWYDPRSEFYEHEGRRREELLGWTLAAGPTHVLAIDADEFVSDGPGLRECCERRDVKVWSLDLEEVWELDGDCVCVRTDGGWAPHPAPVLWAVPPAEHLARPEWHIQDAALACGREPVAVRQARFQRSGASLLHFGWACAADRAARHARYAEHDAGNFHARRHLDSIVSGAARLEGLPWPEGLERWRPQIEERSRRGTEYPIFGEET